MREQAKLSSKGQITIPVNVRNALRVTTGDGLIFELDRGEIVMRSAGRKGAFKKYRGIGNEGVKSGRKAILDSIAVMRGHASDEE